MAIINCQYCGHKVSTTADRCPGCGAPVVVPESSVPEPEVSVPQSQPALEDVPEEQEEPKSHKWVLYVFILVAVWFLIYCLLNARKLAF